MKTGSFRVGSDRMLLKPLQRPVPKEVLYLTYLVVPRTIKFARLSVFDVTWSTPSVKCLLPRGDC